MRPSADEPALWANTQLNVRFPNAAGSSGSRITLLRIVVVPPSTSFAPAEEPAAAPVTRARIPETVLPSCLAPPDEVGWGFATAQRPEVAVSVPAALRTQPRLISRSSNSGPQLAAA